jgi:hypothetical protein
MTCRDIDNLMSTALKNPAHDPQVIEHLGKCGACRALVSVLGEGGEETAPLESNLRGIEARIVKTLKPVRPLAPSQFFLFACAIIFLCVVAIGATPFGMNGWGALSLAQRAGIFAALTTSALLLAVSMVGQMVPGSKYALAPGGLPIVILAALLIVLAVAFHPRAEPSFVADGLVCMKNGLTYAIPAVVLFWLVVRRGAMLNPKLIGAAAGGLAGLTGLTVLEINCPNLNVFHIVVWHWGVVLISSGVGALLGATVERIERWRGRYAS